MTTYKIVGPHRVCDRLPGETLSEKDLDVAGVSVDHLIVSGHIESTGKRSAAVSETLEGN
jgi:hypothetical protein